VVRGARGYPADHPCAEHLKHKSWYVEVPLSDDEACSGTFVEAATERYALMQPLNDFLNRALEGFSIPAR
jgi:uncharacterized protein (DUF2461 family)